MICLDTFGGYMHVYIMNDKSHTTIQRYLNELILSYKENNHSIEYAVSDSENTFMACNMVSNKKCANKSSPLVHFSNKVPDRRAYYHLAP